MSSKQARQHLEEQLGVALGSKRDKERADAITMEIVEQRLREEQAAAPAGAAAAAPWMESIWAAIARRFTG